MTHVFEHEMNELKEKLLTMASQAESATSRAVQALVERDDDLARRVQEDDAVLDRFELEVDETSIGLLAKAPLASDLRLITVAMKISQNLERVGDEATKIARRSIDLSQEPQLKPYVDIPRMAAMALGMLKEALDAFVNRKRPGPSSRGTRRWTASTSSSTASWRVLWWRTPPPSPVPCT
jgi:phosphate transport system protein